MSISRLFTLNFGIALFVLISHFCEKQTDSFTIWAISSNRPYDPTFDTRPLNLSEEKELAIALSQKYHYFGCGGQAYAAFSEDGRYAIKFFKQRLFKRSLFLNSAPLPFFLHRFREKRNFKRDDKLIRDFFSYRVAFDELQQETSLVYVHLNSTDHLRKKLTVTDRLGIAHQIDLDRTNFVVQRRANMIYDRIDELMKRGDEKRALEVIGSVFSLIVTRAEKGFIDRDPNVRTNCGLIEDRAIKIDVGRFIKADVTDVKKYIEEELLEISTPFREWIQEKHPSLIPSFDQKLAEVAAP